MRRSAVNTRSLAGSRTDSRATDLRRMDNFFMDLMTMRNTRRADGFGVDVALDFGRAQIEAGADTIGIGDAAASQISRDLYEEFILPREQRLVAD